MRGEGGTPLTHRGGRPTLHGGWASVHGGQRSISLEYQICPPPYPFDTLVTGMIQTAVNLSKRVGLMITTHFRLIWGLFVAAKGPKRHYLVQSLMFHGPMWGPRAAQWCALIIQHHFDHPAGGNTPNPTFGPIFHFQMFLLRALYGPQET